MILTCLLFSRKSLSEVTEDRPPASVARRTMGKSGTVHFTEEGHVKGMLDRDQRTAKLPHTCHIVRNSDYHKVKPGTAPTNPDSIGNAIDPAKNPFRHSRQKFRRNHAYMWKTWQSKYRIKYIAGYRRSDQQVANGIGRT